MSFNEEGEPMDHPYHKRRKRNLYEKRTVKNVLVEKDRTANHVRKLGIMEDVGDIIAKKNWSK